MPQTRSLLIAGSVAALGVAVAAVLTALGSSSYRATTDVYFAPSATLDASAHARVASFAALVDTADGARARVLPDSLVVRVTAIADGADAARSDVAAATERLQARAGTLETSGRGLTATVVTPAGRVTPLARPWLRDLLLGLGLGALLGAVVAAGAGRRSRALRTRTDVTAVVPTWAVDGVPVAGQTTALVQVADAAGAYDRLATGLRYLDVDSDGRTVVLTAARVGHDTTEVAVRLASRLAAADSSVVLVDAALARPEVADLLGLVGGHDRGLTSVLAGDDDLADALVVHEPTGLTVLPAGPAVPLAASIMSSRALEHLLTDLRREHTTVLMVTDALDSGDGAAWAAGAADSVVLVLRTGRDSDRSLLAGADALEAHGGRLRAVVLTEVAPATATPSPAPAPPVTDPEELVLPLPASVIPAQRTPDAAEQLDPQPESELDPEPEPDPVPDPEASSLSLLEEFLTDEPSAAVEVAPLEESAAKADPHTWPWADDEEPTESIWRPRAR